MTHLHDEKLYVCSDSLQAAMEFTHQRGVDLSELRWLNRIHHLDGLSDVAVWVVSPVSPELEFALGVVEKRRGLTVQLGLLWKF